MNNKLINFINLIKVAYKNNKPFLIISYYNIVLNFVKILYKNGFISHYEILPNDKIKITLKYFDDKPMIQNIDVISTPTYKLYKKHQEIFYIKPTYVDKNKKSNVTKFFKLKNKLKKFNLSYINNLKYLKNILNKKESSEVISLKTPYNNILKNLNIKLIKLNKKLKNNKNTIKFSYKYKKLTNSSNYKNSIATNVNNIKHKKSYLTYNTLKSNSSHINTGGILILSTPKGFMTHKEAYRNNLGGLLICEIY